MTSGGKRTGSVDWKAKETRELLAKLVADGLAYSAIAAEMSAALGVKVTRSAIAGAMLRYGRDFARPAASHHEHKPRFRGHNEPKPRKRGFTFAPATKAERALVAKPPKEAPLPKPVVESRPVGSLRCPQQPLPLSTLGQ